jgi:hypothetical protein
VGSTTNQCHLCAACRGRPAQTGYVQGGDQGIETHEAALEIAARYGYSIYDGLILAVALEADCDTLYTEDMQNDPVIGSLTIRNPFLNV